MRKKVLITGLGYISFDLCSILNSQEYDITVIDNQYFPDRIAACARKGIKFIKRDIFDIEDLLKDAEIVVHSAGLTLVPQKISDESPQIRSEIHRVGTLATRDLIKNVNPKAKVIFLSSHVCYENLENVQDVTEDIEPFPTLAYPKSKRDSEIDLFNSDLDFIVLRLGSVFGYNNAIRWRIVTNLFPLKAALGEKITVMGAKVVKPIAGVFDVANCIKFFFKSKLSREIYHICSEHKTVEELALICKKFAPNLEIEYSNQEVLNNGYTLSNQKILDTGFTFQQDIETEIGKMVKLWSV